MADLKRYRSPEDMTDPFYTDGTVDYDRVQGNNPLAGGDYPRMLYRAGTDHKIHGHHVDTVVVYDADDEGAHAAEGWHRTPKASAALPQPPKPDPRDAEIAALRAALIQKNEGEPENGEQDKPRRGRPPKIEADA